MPKKLTRNPKAIEKTNREADKKRIEQQRLEEEMDRRLWQDNDPTKLRKDKRRQERDIQQAERLQRKLENQRLLAEEERMTGKASEPESFASVKLTRSQIHANLEKIERAQQRDSQICNSGKNGNQNGSDGDESLGDNAVSDDNQMDFSRTNTLHESAHGIDQALHLLNESLADSKKVRTTYLQFQDHNLTRLKRENPTLRLSQVKELLRKEWSKSPLNPLNQ